MDRRTVLAGMAAVLALPTRAPTRTVAAPGDFVVDWQHGERTPAVAASLREQIALVRALPIDPAIAAFFAAQVITVDEEPGTKTRAVPSIHWERRPVPADNPVLLHELLHRFHIERLPGGRSNPDVLRHLAAARAGGRYPAQAYMLRDPLEFFAMTASVVLHGRAARPPSRREIAAERSPELYAWIVRTFGLRLA